MSKDKGLGDTVAAITKATGIEKAVTKLNGGRPCGGCKKRRKILNRIFPYRANMFEDKQETEWPEYTFGDSD